MKVRFEALKVVIEDAVDGNPVKVELRPSAPEQGKFALTVTGQGVTDENAREIASDILGHAIREAVLD